MLTDDRLLMTLIQRSFFQGKAEPIGITELTLETLSASERRQSLGGSPGTSDRGQVRRTP